MDDATMAPRIPNLSALVSAAPFTLHAPLLHRCISDRILHPKAHLRSLPAHVLLTLFLG